MCSSVLVVMITMYPRLDDSANQEATRRLLGGYSEATVVEMVEGGEMPLPSHPISYPAWRLPGQASAPCPYREHGRNVSPSMACIGFPMDHRESSRRILPWSHLRRYRSPEV